MLTKEECLEALNYLASGQCSYCWKNNGDKVTDFECHESYELLVKLINEYFKLEEKATAKKVQYSYFNHQLANYHCINCGEAQGLKVNKRWRKFCPHCGQRLDWSEEDD